MRYGLSHANRGDFSDRRCFPTQSSVLDEEALLHRVVPEYDIPHPVCCVFLSRGDADIYQVHTTGPTFYLKVYRPPNPTLVEAETEARLVCGLSERGASVVRAVPRRDGSFASQIMASEGPRTTLLFEAAPDGAFVPDDLDTCQRLGAAVATMHAAADDVDLEPPTAHEWAPLLPFVQRLAYEEDYTELVATLGELEERLKATTGDADDDVGWCHFDLVRSNIRCRADGAIVFFDFGNFQYVSRPNEFSRVRGTLSAGEDEQLTERRWAAFVTGYGQVRQVPAHGEDTERLRLLAAIQRTRWVGGVMATCTLRMGTETFNRDWVRTQLHGIRTAAASVPGSA